MTETASPKVMRENSTQILVINSLRGIAALAVCLFHFVVTTIGYVSNENLLKIFHYGSKGVELFFIISGIVIPLSLINSNYRILSIGRYLLRRFIRIEPPYLVAVALAFTYLFVRNYIPSSAKIDLTPSFQDTLLHVGYLVPFVEGSQWMTPVFWTLSVEFQYYIFLALLFPLALSNKKTGQWMFTLLIITLPFTTPNPGFFLHWSSYFGIGIFYALYITKRYSLYEFIASAALCSLTVYFKQGFMDLCIAWAALIIIHVIPGHTSGIGFFLGKISYSLYLLHTIVGVAFINFMSHRYKSPMEKFLVISAGLAITIISAYLFWKLIERPSQLKAQKIKIKGV